MIVHVNLNHMSRFALFDYVFACYSWLSHSKPWNHMSRFIRMFLNILNVLLCVLCDYGIHKTLKHKSRFMYIFLDMLNIPYMLFMVTTLFVKPKSHVWYNPWLNLNTSMPLVCPYALLNKILQSFIYAKYLNEFSHTSFKNTKHGTINNTMNYGLVPHNTKADLYFRTPWHEILNMFKCRSLTHVGDPALYVIYGIIIKKD